MDLRLSEWIALSYFLYLAAVATRATVPAAQRRRVVAVAAAAAILILALPAAGGAISLMARDWTPLLYLAVGYWSPALLVRAPNERLEKALLDFDRRWLYRQGPLGAGPQTDGRTPGPDGPGSPRPWQLSDALRRVVVEWAELSYLSCYPLVPLGFACFYVAGLRAEADRFWTPVLLAVLPCYGTLPWLPARPPRVIEGPPAGASTVRPLNLHLLQRASVQLNTFPSAHVAGAVATALVVSTELPAAGLVLSLIAAGIAAGSIVGRYHYVADVLAGAALAVAAFSISRAI